MHGHKAADDRAFLPADSATIGQSARLVVAWDDRESFGYGGFGVGDIVRAWPASAKEAAIALAAYRSSVELLLEQRQPLETDLRAAAEAEAQVKEAERLQAARKERKQSAMGAMGGTMGGSSEGGGLHADARNVASGPGTPCTASEAANSATAVAASSATASAATASAAAPAAAAVAASASAAAALAAAT